MTLRRALATPGGIWLGSVLGYIHYDHYGFDDCRVVSASTK